MFVLAADTTMAAPFVWGCTALAGSAGKVGAVQLVVAVCCQFGLAVAAAEFVCGMKCSFLRSNYFRNWCVLS